MFLQLWFASRALWLPLPVAVSSERTWNVHSVTLLKLCYGFVSVCCSSFHTSCPELFSVIYDRRRSRHPYCIHCMQEWRTPKYFTKWNMAIGCLALPAVHRLCMKSCWIAGPRTRWSGRHLKHCSGSWKSSLWCQQANTLTQPSLYARRPPQFFPCFSFCTRHF